MLNFWQDRIGLHIDDTTIAMMMMMMMMMMMVMMMIVNTYRIIDYID